MTDTRSITKELIHFSLPLILSGLLQQLYSWADAFIVGHAGAAGETMLAAIGSVTTITNLLIQSIVGFTLGLSILAAQEYGRGSKERLGVVSAHFLPLLCAVYTILAFLMISGVRPILQFMDTPAELLEYAIDYLRVILVGIPFLAIYNLFAALFRAVGDSKVAFYAVLLSSILNVILDILLVLVFPFGVQGAAIATVLSQAMMTLFILLYGCRRYPELMPKRGFRADPSVLQAGARLGFPPMLQNSIVSLGNLILQNFMNNFGAATVLAITTAYRVDLIMLLPIINSGAAISSMAARAYGEGDFRKLRTIRFSSCVLMVCIALFLTVSMYLFGASFIAFFGVTGQALAEGQLFFRDISVFYTLFGAAIVLRSVLEGTGDVTFCSAAGIATLGVRIGGSYLLRPLLGSRAIAFAEGISWTVLLLLMIFRTLQTRKKLL